MKEGQMRTFAIVTTLLSVFASAAQAQTKPRTNLVAGTWQPVSASVEINGEISMPYGPAPQGKLVFTEDLFFVELLFDPRIPKIASNVRGGGTDAENKAIMAGILALEGRYTVDADGQFSGNTVEGASFPNWIGDVRGTTELTMRLEGTRMIENFQRPGGAKVTIVWERAR
jgi:hypothetical protein